MKKDYLEALMKALIVGAVVLLIFTGAWFASEMDKRIESSAQRPYVFSTYLKDDAIRVHSLEGVYGYFLPAYNDIINTTVSGALFGKILYRLSSNILDDRSTGVKRFFREFVAAILTPVHVRDYDYSGGGEAKFEGTLNLGKIGQATAIYYLYWLHTYIGPAGDKIMSIFKPRIAVKLFSNLSLGFEYLYYHKGSYLRDFPDVHKNKSEQKIYLMLYF